MPSAIERSCVTTSRVRFRFSSEISLYDILLCLMETRIDGPAYSSTPANIQWFWRFAPERSCDAMILDGTCQLLLLYRHAVCYLWGNIAQTVHHRGPAHHQLSLLAHRHYQTRHQAPSSSWRREAHQWSHLRGDSRCAQGVPGERDQGRCDLHRACPPQDRDRLRRRLRAQASRTHPVRIWGIGSKLVQSKLANKHRCYFNTTFQWAGTDLLQ